MHVWGGGNNLWHIVRGNAYTFGVYTYSSMATDARLLAQVAMRTSKLVFDVAHDPDARAVASFSMLKVWHTR